MSEDRIAEHTLDEEFDIEEADGDEEGRAQASGSAPGPGEGADTETEHDSGEPSGEPDATLGEDEASQPLVVERGGQTPLRQGRRETRLQNLANENRQLRQRLDALEQRSGGEQQRLFAEQQRQQEEQERQQEQQVLQSMDPAAIARFYSERTQRQIQRDIQVTRFQLFDTNDQANFDRELASNTSLSRFYQQNIDRFNELRRAVPGASRLDILDKVVGEVARRQMGAARTRQQTRAANGAAQVQTRAPAAGRSNVASERGTTGRGPRRGWEHMRNVPI